VSERRHAETKRTSRALASTARMKRAMSEGLKPIQTSSARPSRMTKGPVVSESGSRGARQSYVALRVGVPSSSKSEGEACGEVRDGREVGVTCTNDWEEADGSGVPCAKVNAKHNNVWYLRSFNGSPHSRASSARSPSSPSLHRESQPRRSARVSQRSSIFPASLPWEPPWRILPGSIRPDSPP
jgi:hypothetical protein